MIDYWYKKLWHLFRWYGNPNKWRNQFKVKFGIDAWDEGSLNVLYVIYDFHNENAKEYIATHAPIPRIKLLYDGNIDDLISKINSSPNLSSTEVIYIPNEINNVDHLNKLKDSFPNKNIFVQWSDDTLYIDEVISATYMIDYYKQVINEADLSPLEKITMAYDIIKSFNYKKSHKGSQASQLFNSGAFKCRGFIQFFNKLLSEFGITSRDMSVKINHTLHARCIAQVYDEKYQKNDVFVFDPTFDSISNVNYYNFKEDVAMSSARKKRGYIKGDSLCQYRNFLVPLISYEKTFPDSYNESISHNIHNTEELQKYLHTNQSDHEIKALSTEDFIKLIYRVRLAEGYSIDDMPKIIQEALFASGYEYYRLDNIKNYLATLDEDTKQMAA